MSARKGKHPSSRASDERPSLEAVPPSDNESKQVVNTSEEEKEEEGMGEAQGADEIVEDIRAQRMRCLLAQCTTNFVSRVRKSQQFFPYLKGRKAATLKKFSESLSTQLGNFLTEEFDQLMGEYNLVTALNKLDEIDRDPMNHTKDGSAAWRPSSNTERDVSSHDKITPTYAQSLQEKLAQLNEENRRLEEDLLFRRQMHSKAMVRMEQMWEKVTKLESALDEGSLENVADFLTSQHVLGPNSVLTRSRRKRRT